MSLSGNLGFVSLDEVLRLLTRSGQHGAVDVRGEQVRGRIFITKGGIGLATTSDDEALHRHLSKAGLIDEDRMGSEDSLAPLVEKNGGAIVELLREMTVESLYQLGLNGEGFDVHEGATSRYVSPDAFELESLLADSKQRLTDWAEVSRVVDDLKAPVTLVRDIGDREEVKIDRDGWKVLSEVGSGASVEQMASELGTTEFWTARVAARLIEKDLVEFVVVEQPVEAPVHEEPVHEEPAYEEPNNEEATAEHPSQEWDFAGAASQDDDPEDVDPNESWWQEPEPESESSETPAAEESAAQEAVAHEVVSQEAGVDEDTMPTAESADPDYAQEDHSQIPTLADEADDAEDEDGETAEVEEDTEAFLEKVFSELEAPEEPKADEEEEGYGLLRRRRMGAIRDLSNDS